MNFARAIPNLAAYSDMQQPGGWENILSRLQQPQPTRTIDYGGDAPVQFNGNRPAPYQQPMPVGPRVDGMPWGQGFQAAQGNFPPTENGAAYSGNGRSFSRRSRGPWGY